MKKHFLLLAFLTASLSFTFVSCKKEKDPEPSRKELLTGSWNIKAAGQDQNNNNVLETSEYDSTFAAASVFGAIVKQTFNADGSGSVNATLGWTGSSGSAF